MTHKVYRPLVVSALRNDDVGILLCRLNKLLMHRLQDCFISLQNHLYGSATLNNVALNNAYQAVVGIGIDKDFQVHQVAHLLVVQSKDSLDDDNFFWLNVYRFRQTVAFDVRIGRLFNRLSVFQVAYLL